MFQKIGLAVGVCLFSLQGFCSHGEIVTLFDISALDPVAWRVNLHKFPLYDVSSEDPFSHQASLRPSLEIDYFPEKGNNNRWPSVTVDGLVTPGSLPTQIEDLAILHQWNSGKPVLHRNLLNNLYGELLVTGGHHVNEHFLVQLLDSPVQRVVITGAHRLNGYHMSLIRYLVVNERKTLTFTGTGLATDPNDYSKITYSPRVRRRESNLMDVTVFSEVDGLPQEWCDITS